ncbi:AbrB/MazE/SpoVT family DNA-binding domain-containing protein [Vulcanococcus limneticus]|uniref:AbrB/MazE/SpoVT family DNA-binding domain-containing protein n=1 Tax=Vulcanococcus limneticus TaxID=2170428 RepID=UPI00398BBF50
MPFTPSRRRHRVLLRRWSHSLAVRLPARLLREAGFSEDTPLSAELDSDGSLRLRAEASFDRLRFSWDQQQRLHHLACTEPSWPLLRQLPAAAAQTSPAQTAGATPAAAATAEPDPCLGDGSWEPSPTYVDTGLLMPLICREPGSEDHLRWFGIEQRLLVTSALTLLEASAALALKGLDPADLRDCQHALQRLLHGGGLSLYQLSEAELRAWAAGWPARLAPPTDATTIPPLHPLVLQHLATALASGCRRLISPDPALRLAASRAGLQAHAPLLWPTRLRLPSRPPMGDWPPPSPIRP